MRKSQAIFPLGDKCVNGINIIMIVLYILEIIKMPISYICVCVHIYIYVVVQSPSGSGSCDPMDCSTPDLLSFTISRSQPKFMRYWLFLGFLNFQS